VPYVHFLLKDSAVANVESKREMPFSLIRDSYAAHGRCRFFEKNRGVIHANTISPNEDREGAILERVKALAVKRRAVKNYSHRAAYFSALQMPFTIARIRTATRAR
jgi:hypothetical protein